MTTTHVRRRLSAFCLVLGAGTWLVLSDNTAQSQLPGRTLEPGEKAFLHILGISGESADPDHEGWIDIASFSYGLSRPAGDPTALDLAPPPATHRGLSLVKNADRATGLLYLHCNSGQPIEEVVLEVTRTTEHGITVQEYRLRNVIVTSIQTSGGTRSGGQATERVTLHYGSIEWTYLRLDPATGGVISEVAMQWNRAGSDTP
jgi:type VI secretion system secreted protein Hcp